MSVEVSTNDTSSTLSKLEDWMLQNKFTKRMRQKIVENDIDLDTLKNANTSDIEEISKNLKFNGIERLKLKTAVLKLGSNNPVLLPHQFEKLKQLNENKCKINEIFNFLNTLKNNKSQNYIKFVMECNEIINKNKSKINGFVNHLLKEYQSKMKIDYEKFFKKQQELIYGTENDVLTTHLQTAKVQMEEYNRVDSKITNLIDKQRNKINNSTKNNKMKHHQTILDQYGVTVRCESNTNEIDSHLNNIPNINEDLMEFEQNIPKINEEMKLYKNNINLTLFQNKNSLESYKNEWLDILTTKNWSLNINIDQLNTVKQIKELCHNKIKECKNNKLLCKNEINDLKQEIISISNKTNKKISTEILKLKKEKDCKNSKKGKLKQENEIINNVIKTLKSQNFENNHKILTTKLEKLLELNNQLKTYKKQKKVLKSGLKDKKSEFKLIQNRIKNLENLSNKPNNKITQLQKKNENLTQENKKLKLSLKELQNKYDKLSQKNDKNSEETSNTENVIKLKILKTKLDNFHNKKFDKKFPEVTKCLKLLPKESKIYQLKYNHSIKDTITKYFKDIQNKNNTIKLNNLAFKFEDKIINLNRTPKYYKMKTDEINTLNITLNFIMSHYLLSESLYNKNDLNGLLPYKFKCTNCNKLRYSYLPCVYHKNSIANEDIPYCSSFTCSDSIRDDYEIDCDYLQESLTFINNKTLFINKTFRIKQKEYHTILSKYFEYYKPKHISNPFKYSENEMISQLWEHEFPFYLIKFKGIHPSEIEINYDFNQTLNQFTIFDEKNNFTKEKFNNEINIPEFLTNECVPFQLVEKNRDINYDNKIYTVLMHKHTIFDTVYRVYNHHCSQYKISENQVIFCYKDKIIDEDSTPDSLDLYPTQKGVCEVIIYKENYKN